MQCTQVALSNITLGSVGEWAAAVVALVALILSALAFRTSRADARTSKVLALEERMLTEDLARGRRELYKLESAADVESLRKEPERWDCANQAVVLWNKMAQYAQNGIVDKDLAGDLWDDALIEVWPHIQHFVRFRRHMGAGNATKWSALVQYARTLNAKIVDDDL